MKINKKAIKIYSYTFVSLLIFLFLVVAFGLENNTRGGPHISGAIHLKSLYELWQAKYAILLVALMATPLVGSFIYYINRHDK
jgi:hypothetical protein